MPFRPLLSLCCRRTKFLHLIIVSFWTLILVWLPISLFLFPFPFCPLSSYPSLFLWASAILLQLSSVLLNQSQSVRIHHLILCICPLTYFQNPSLALIKLAWFQLFRASSHSSLTVSQYHKNHQVIPLAYFPLFPQAQFLLMQVLELVMLEQALFEQHQE